MFRFCVVEQKAPSSEEIYQRIQKEKLLRDIA